MLWIVLAADSALSSSRIATLETAGRLYKSGRRDSPADTLAQPSTSTLDTLCATVLRTAQREPADLCAIVNDADHRKSRTAEINRWATQAFPETVTAEQCFSTGTSSGHLEAAAAELYALAIAHHLAQEQQQPALAVSVGDAITRSALLVAPDTPANIPAPKAQS